MTFNSIGLIISSTELIIVLVAVLLPFTLFIIGLVDLMKRHMTHSDKLIWVLLILLAPILGPILYLTIGRKRHPRTIEQISSWTL